MSDAAHRGFRSRLPGPLRRADPAVLISFGCILLLLLIGSMYSRNFLSFDYLMQQLKVASFLGVIATGMMLVILLGHIDLSVPWVVSTGAMMASAAAAYGLMGEILSVPFGILCGVAIGLVNGFGVAYLRIPSMIVTLATNAVAQGLMVVYTGGFSPQDSASPVMRWLATGFLIPGVPNAVLVWVLIGAGAVFLLTRTTFGRSVYGIGNRERAVYLSGVNTRRVVLVAFAIAGATQCLRRCAARRLCLEGGAVDGGRLPPAVDRSRGTRRNPRARRSRLLPRHRGRRDPYHPAAVHPLGHADGGGGAAAHLRRGHHRHAPHLRPTARLIARRA